jgi:hypothetical protein
MIRRRPQSASTTSRTPAREGNEERDDNGQAPKSSREGLTRPRTAGAPRRRKEFHKTLAPQKKVHAYKLGKTLSVSLKDTIYSGRRRKTLEVPEPVR